jgi:hypothetical protein
MCSLCATSCLFASLRKALLLLSLRVSRYERNLQACSVVSVLLPLPPSSTSFTNFTLIRSFSPLIYSEVVTLCFSFVYFDPNLFPSRTVLAPCHRVVACALLRLLGGVRAGAAGRSATMCRWPFVSLRLSRNSRGD